MDKRKNRTVICLGLIVFMLSVSVSSSLFTSLFASNYNFDNDVDLETSGVNTLYNGISYPFEITDVYDDENYTKIYTDAYLQTEYNQNGTVFEDQVSVVNNTNYKSPSNTDVSMIDGTFDDTDNMKVNDDSNSEFTSTEDLDYQGTHSFEDGVVGGHPVGWTVYEGGYTGVSLEATVGDHEMVISLRDWSTSSCWARNTFSSGQTYGTIEWYFRAAGISASRVQDIRFGWTPLEDTQTVFRLISDAASIKIQHGAGTTTVFTISANTWYHFRVTFDSTDGGYDGNGVDQLTFYVDEVDKGTFGFWHAHDTIDMLSAQTWGGGCAVNERLYYDAFGYSWDPNYNVGDNLVEPIPATVDFTVDLNFNEVDASKLLALDVSSHHYTNVSTTIVGNVYDYDSSSYTEMFSSDNVAETENYFMNDTITSDFLSASGNLRLCFTGANSTTNFKLSIDYIRVRFYYKMDITIDKTFYINGIWRYRFKLIGSLHYTDWTVFEVIDPPPNFYAISESDLTTKWILQGAEISPVEDFHDDINTDYWNLIDVSENSFKSFISDLDYLSDNISVAIPIEEVQYTGTWWDYGAQDTLAGRLTWDGTYFWLTGNDNNEVFKYYSNGTYTGTHFDTGTEMYQTYGITWDGTHFWIIGGTNKVVYKYDSTGTYTTTSFGIGSVVNYPSDLVWDGTHFWIMCYDNDEVYKYNSAGVYQDVHFDVGTEDGYPMGITWDGTDFWIIGDSYNKVYKYDSSGTYTGTYFDVGTEDGYPMGITWDGTHFWVAGGYHDNAYQYDPKNNISKNYFGSGYMYMQTNTTELISLKSQDYGSHKTLSSGDYFEVDFQTSSDSKIELILLKNGVINKTLTLSQSGNTNFNRHTAQISVSEDLEFDQLKISSNFEDMDNVKVYDVKTYKYTITGDYVDFYVGSKRDREIYLTPDTYNLRIFDPYDGDVVINENITIPATGVKQYLYVPIGKIQCRLTLFNIGKENQLDFMDYHITINRSLNGIYGDFELLESIFSVDEGTYVYISVSDRFDTLIIDSFERLASDYIDLELGVYSLQIKNLMTQKTRIYINETHDYPLLSGDSIYFMLSEAHYQIGYYDTNDVYKQFTIYLNSNQAYQLNRSKICFLSYADQQGTHLFFENYKTYINNSLLYENMFYREIGDSINITIKDRYDIQIHSEIYEVISGDNYIPITLGVWELKIKNERLNPVSYILNNIDVDVNRIGSLFENEILTFEISPGNYNFSYLEEGESEWEYFTFVLSDNEFFVLNRSQMCFLSYADQQGNHLSFDNYKTYINGSMIYQQIFYEDAGDDVNITITDRYDYEVYQGVYSVTSGDNYIPITLTMYSLKVYNQQEVFNHVNITRDPNYYSSPYFWSEWVAPGEIMEFKLFAGNYVINLTDNENGYSSYGYELAGDDTLLISSSNTIFNVLYNLANMNSTIGNQITYICVNLTNQNSDINNSIVFLTVNIESLNSSLGNLLVDMDFSISNIANNISSLYVFTNNSFINLDNQINNSFIYIENNIISINQSISMLVLGIDNSISILNGTVTTMFTEMNQQFIVTQTSIDFSFTSLNQSIVQLANNISTNQVVLYNLIEQRANDIDENVINIQTLINLLNSTVANESLVVQTLVNIIGNNITENHLIINNLINLLGNNITENNLQLVSILELIGNNITTNHFVLQTLIDVIGNNITSNHFELLTNLNLINTTIGVNQIELINSILLINSTISDLVLELTNQILFVNDTIYTAVLDLSTSVEFGVDVILGNISLTYQQNDFLTELYKETMFSQLLNWTDVAYNYSLMEDRIDVWEFINNYKNQSIEVHLRYQDIIDNLTITAQNSILQYLPKYDTDYNLWSVEDQEYLDEWKPLPENRTVPFGFYEEVVPDIPDWNAPNTVLMIVIILMACGSAIALVGYSAYRYRKKSENYRRSYADKITLEAQTIKNFSQGKRIK